jgi:7-cyano-7-deazaguanine synthase in queuosine biosynthesis
MKHLIMFSGGLDSTYLAWKFLTENKKLHLHHISLRNESKFPWELQDEACQKIVSFFKKQGFEFEYSASVFEFFGFRGVGLDVDVQLLFAQKVAQNFRHSEVTVYIGLNCHDMIRSPIPDRKLPQIQNIWKALIENTRYGDHINKTLNFPLIDDNTTKPEMIRNMPKNLYDLTWSCRKPIDNKPCGSCHSCREKIEATK